jgi:UDP-N-acetylmuramoylalanine--D-glutamate ligase
MILVVGLGVVGKAILRFCARKNLDACFFDDKIKTFENIPFFLFTNATWNKIQYVAISPGIPLHHPLILEAQARNVEITNDISIFLRTHIDGFKIGITGTVGKSSTCSLLQHIIGDTAAIGGNFGTSPLDLPESKYYIIELSSYQLESMTKQDIENFDIGVITNIFHHHLDRHKTFENYIKIKQKMCYAKKTILGDCKIFEGWPYEIANTSTIQINAPLFQKQEYQQHWQIVEKICQHLKLNIQDASQKAKDYQPLTFRQQIIRTDPILIINDSKSTTSVATIQACKNMNTNFIWIAGGVEEDANWQELKNINKIQHVFICGDANKLKQSLEQFKIPYTDFAGAPTDRFSLAVQNALKTALEQKIPLLFSPGHQSFNAFDNFEHRGAIFNEIITTYINTSTN